MGCGASKPQPSGSPNVPSTAVTRSKRSISSAAPTSTAKEYQVLRGRALVVVVVVVVVVLLLLVLTQLPCTPRCAACSARARWAACCWWASRRQSPRRSR